MKKVLTCILSFVPLISTVLMGVTLAIFGIASEEGMLYGSAEDAMIIGLLVIMLFYVIAMFGIMIYFIVITCKNPNLSTGMKILWCFLHYQFNALAFPVYWFIYILRE